MVPLLLEFLAVGLGGAIGATARGLFCTLVNRHAGSRFPYATLLVNLIGSFLLGLLMSAQLGHMAGLLLTVGMLGGFSTYSTANFETVALYTGRRRRQAIIYIAATYCLSFAMAGLGLAVGALLKPA